MQKSAAKCRIVHLTFLDICFFFHKSLCSSEFSLFIVLTTYGNKTVYVADFHYFIWFCIGFSPFLYLNFQIG